MEKSLSHRKTRCFVRVAMFKKTSDAVKKCIVFFIDVSSIFREKSMKNCAKNLKNGIAHKNRQKSAFGMSFFSKKTIFGRFLVSLWVSRGLPGRPGSSILASPGA